MMSGGVLSLLLISLAVAACYDVTTLYRLEKLPIQDVLEVDASCHSSQNTGVIYSYLDGELTYPTNRCDRKPPSGSKFYRVASVEVHARTDALGMPFKMPNGSLVGPTVGSPLLECSAIARGCNWSSDGWRRTEVLPNTPLPPLELSKLASEAFPTNTMRLGPFQDTLSFSFNSRNHDMTLIIYLLDDQADVHKSSLYFIILGQYYHSSKVVKCGGFSVASVDLPVQDISRDDCMIVSEFSKEIYWNEDFWYNYTVNLQNGRLTLEETVRSSSKKTIIEWVDNEPINISLYMINSYPDDGEILFPTDNTILALTKKHGSLVSPLFVPGSAKICVAITYYLPEDSESNLVVSAVTPTGQKFSLKPSISEKGAWRTNRLMADVESSQEVKLEVIGDGGVLVQRIAGCNSEDEEEIFGTMDENLLKDELIGWDVSARGEHSAATNLVESDESCLNGGKHDWQKNVCQCPSGFKGRRCEQGCWIDHFGQDCGGVCSKLERGCRGYKLCGPGQPCLCAPGYGGDGCDTDCDNKTYGAGCTQQCGMCRNGASCDRSTGACPDGCRTGFVAPLCKEEYSYVEEPPKVTPVDFTVLLVEFKWQLGGVGSPRFLQIQYREVGTDAWERLVPTPVTNSGGTQNVTGLIPGTLYQVRVVLVDRDGTIYEGERVPVVVARTLCTVPEAVHYGLEAKDVSSTEFRAAWKFTRDKDTWCKVTHFELELKDTWQWLLVANGSEMEATVSMLRPSSQFAVRVRAMTSDGPIAFSPIVYVTTSEEVPGLVLDLQVTDQRTTELQLNWSELLDSRGHPMQYIVKYRCEYLLSCPSHNCSDSAGNVTVKVPFANLQGLLPHAQYSVRVAAVSEEEGPSRLVLAATNHTAPTISPAPAQSTVSKSTNTSLCASWSAPADCSALNGYLYNYPYRLLTGGSAVLEGKTEELSACFSDLVPNTQYELHVFLETSGGWSENYPLVIKATTRVTVPDTVQQLEVYKRGKRMLGLRWATPLHLYGQLSSFTVGYHVAGGEPISTVEPPKSCPAWPNMFCHTLSGLRANTEYVLSVRARNVEVNEDGEAAVVTATTRESAPEAPTDLRVTNQTDTTLDVEWSLPRMLNGQLRSFLLSVEETDTADSDACCESFPLQEVVLRSEQQWYQHQFSGLRPAARYTVSISAKTVALGPAVSAVATTRPARPSLAPPVGRPGDGVVTLQPVTEQRALVRGYLLIVLPEDTDQEVPRTALRDQELQGFLEELVGNSTFYIAGEFAQNRLEASPEVPLGTGSDPVEGLLARTEDPEMPSKVKFRLGVAVVLEYAGLQNLAYVDSPESWQAP